MRKTIKNYIDAVKARREQGEEAGFSLVELIVVVVILGILAAVAIPIFSGLQDNARESAAKAAAANAISEMAAAVAGGSTPVAPTDTADFEYTWSAGSGSSDIDTWCVQVQHTGGGDPQEAGGGC